MDPWIPHKVPLVSKAFLFIPEPELTKYVVDYCKPDWSWDLSSFVLYLPQDILDIVVALPTLAKAPDPNILAWNHSINGLF